MLIRFRSKNGIHRVSCEDSELFGAVIKRLLGNLDANADANTFTVSEKPGQDVHTVSELANRTVADLGLKHGDMLIFSYSNQPNTETIDTSVGTGSVDIGVKNGRQKSLGPLKIKELDVDEELEKEKGLIPRQKSKFCKHGDRGMCEYCSPLPPWDKEYHEANKIKHISFHSYLKKLNENANKKENGSSYIAPLSEPDFRINKHCNNGHEPWPRGICSKCQPSAITLQQQEFRMVDHVEFQKSELINEFIQAWRCTGMQRFGYMYGSYAKYDNTPLGIKAVVEAIYEPPQHDEQDGLTMDVEQVKEEMLQIDLQAQEMGLSRIGLIFTDLSDAGAGDGSVYCKRHKDSFFLSSIEVIMAAGHQTRYPNVSKFSEQGIFSSKFVTCVISGNLEGEIDISSYQVSTDAEALVTADMISGSTYPSMAYIDDTTDERYVPEIFYMKSNEYGITVKENAKPAFPVDYLLVTLTHGFPKNNTDTNPKFATSTEFPWANRQALGQSQDYQELKKYLFQVASSGVFNLLHEKISNFHLLIYINTLQVLSPEEWKLLIESAIRTEWEEPLLKLVSSAGWQTLVMILQESG
ncbi:nuclear protein localization protein 4 [Saccharomyces pastorianus]|uniref:Nuclear protein localization protein 4 n=1 Tax=Saccharomyces pastorianus TaxID=27292 RepID=A0A6C1E5C7_SACPS|nr:nuclear protein localization protein 4 [Saccharomyces pastorianus]